MVSHVVASVALVGAAVAFWWTLTVGHAWIRRERFVHDMMTLRDRVEMDVFTGALPDVPPVQFVWAKSDFMHKYPEMASMSRVIAVLRHEPLLRSGATNPFKDSGHKLTQKQSKRLYSYESEIIELMTAQLIKGSRYWFAAPLITRALVRTRVKAKTVTSPKTTVLSFNRVMNASSAPGPDGTLTVSKVLEPHSKPARAHRRQASDLVLN